MTRGIARVALGDFDFVQTENVSYQVLIGLCAFQVCVCKSVSQVVKWDITCWRRRFDDGHRYPSFGKWSFIVCLGAVFVHPVQNAEQYSDHGQSETSSFRITASAKT